jgi:hypothetical protein
MSLKNIDFNEPEKRYNANFFNQSKIYPRGYVRKEDDIDGLWKNFVRLREFINITFKKGLGLCLAKKYYRQQKPALVMPLYLWPNVYGKYNVRLSKVASLQQ